jgi:predicted lipid-binding transport protein (Tim44 family)
MNPHQQSPNQQTTYTQYDGNPSFYKSSGGAPGGFLDVIFIGALWIVFKIILVLAVAGFLALFFLLSIQMSAPMQNSPLCAD